MTPSATVDLPQPDSPTRPSAWPGSTVAEKFITAGISPARVKKRDREVLDLEDRLGHRAQSLSDCSRSASASRFSPSTRLMIASAGGRAGWT